MRPTPLSRIRRSTSEATGSGWSPVLVSVTTLADCAACWHVSVCECSKLHSPCSSVPTPQIQETHLHDEYSWAKLYRDNCSTTWKWTDGTSPANLNVQVATGLWGYPQPDCAGGAEMSAVTWNSVCGSLMVEPGTAGGWCTREDCVVRVTSACVWEPGSRTERLQSVWRHGSTSVCVRDHTQSQPQPYLQSQSQCVLHARCCHRQRVPQQLLAQVHRCLWYVIHVCTRGQTCLVDCGNGNALRERVHPVCVWGGGSN